MTVLRIVIKFVWDANLLSDVVRHKLWFLTVQCVRNMPSSRLILSGIFFIAIASNIGKLIF